jgi:hypothetical protein
MADNNAVAYLLQGDPTVTGWQAQIGQMGYSFLTGKLYIKIADKPTGWAAFGEGTAPGLQTTWYVDPQNAIASDSNSGLTSSSPLKTLTEVANRLAWITIPTGVTVTVNLLSDCVNTDKPVWTFMVQPGAIVADGLLILGTPKVIYSGTVTGRAQQTQGSVAASDDNQMTDSGVPTSFTSAGLMASGLLYQRTNSTALWWYALKDLGSNTIRMSDAMTVGRTISALSVSDTYTVSQLPKIYDQSFVYRSNTLTTSHITIQFCADNSAAATSLAQMETALVAYDRCAFQTTRTIPNAVLWNCGAWITAGWGTVFNGNLSIAGGAFIGSGSIVINISRGSQLAGSGSSTTHFQGVGISASQASAVSFTLVAIYDCTLDCISASYGSNIAITALKGKGNTANLFNVLHSSTVVYNHTVAPTTDGSTSLSNPIKVGHATTTNSAGLTSTVGLFDTGYMGGIMPTP